MNQHRHIIQFSGGAGSAMTAVMVAEKYGTENLTLLFADVGDEHADLFRFSDEVAALIGVPITTVKADIPLTHSDSLVWQTFYNKRWLGNSQRAHCSFELKQKVCRRWLEANCDPSSTTLYLGIDWSESHRFEGQLTINGFKKGAKQLWEPWICEAPLTEPPYLDKEDVFEFFESKGIKRPYLNQIGFPHNNCAGRCKKAGKAQWAMLLKVDRAGYLKEEEEERKFREWIGEDYTILTEEINGIKIPLTLKDFRERIESAPQQLSLTGEDYTMLKKRKLGLRGKKEQKESSESSTQLSLFDPSDWGGCGCFVEAGTND